MYNCNLTRPSELSVVTFRGVEIDPINTHKEQRNFFFQNLINIAHMLKPEINYLYFFTQSYTVIVIG